MINLLSPSDKKMLRAARRNTVWSRYTFIIVALLIAVNIILALTLFLIQSQARSYEERITNNAELSNREYRTTKTQAATFRKDLATAKAILDNETNYSSIIVDIARTIPSGCVLSTLTLNAQSFSTPQSLSFRCKTPEDILRLKSALERSTAIFDKVNIVSTSLSTELITDPYAVSINMSVVLKKPLINGKASS